MWKIKEPMKSSRGIIDIIEAIKKLSSSEIFWIFAFSAILLSLVSIFPNWDLSQFLSKYINYIIFICIGTFLRLIIKFIIFLWKKYKIKRYNSRKAINGLLEEWLEIQNINPKLRVISEPREVPTDTNSLEFELGRQSVYHDINIYCIDANQKIIKDFFNLLTKTITILKKLSAEFLFLEDYIDQINSISIDEDFEIKSEVEEYFKNQIRLVIGSLESIKQVISKA